MLIPLKCTLYFLQMNVTEVLSCRIMVGFWKHYRYDRNNKIYETNICEIIMNCSRNNKTSIVLILFIQSTKT